jgi:hypothetical protein
MHYILIIGMLSYPQPFPTLDDCLAMQAAYQQAGNKTSYCVPRSYGTDYSNSMVEKHKAMPRQDYDNTEAFKHGWKEEMEKPEPVTTMEQDI